MSAAPTILISLALILWGLRIADAQSQNDSSDGGAVSAYQLKNPCNNGIHRSARGELLNILPVPFARPVMPGVTSAYLRQIEKV